ncbi:3-isopropylmalate dehydratase large subunit [Candidatus Marinamargulisbacteria bacterium SCGC AG-439-L15]|nr:3-isopropylmalate dehydratase large subunit [Candidatus Marinamargulisbacteria bacterium SCGC AG-439-L15]
MSERTLYDKVWEAHKVATLPSGLDQVVIGLHLVHEVTSPQAFSSLRERGAKVAYPQRTFATMDHIVPTDQTQRPFSDPQAEVMAQALETNTQEFGVHFFDQNSGQQGVVHIVGPERGLTQPGMTIACGDSHTSTHGAFGSLAFGIGTTEVRNVLETQTLALGRLKVRRITINGQLGQNVYAKDVILRIIAELGVKGGLGYAYEYSGEVFDSMSMEERMTVCNMSIEGGARIGYINPDQTTYDYIEGRDYAPKGADFESRKDYWESVRSDEDAVYDDEIEIDGSTIEPMVTWGINPGQAVSVTQTLPEPSSYEGTDQETAKEAYAHMKLSSGDPIVGTSIDVAFIGSCTNGRISDLREAAQVFKGRQVSSTVQAIIVPGSQDVKQQAESEGLDKIFEEAGAEWRGAGCSMCLAMNTDRLKGDQMSASSSNRNFIGRQGSPTGRTLLMSPAMVAAAAVSGKVADVRGLS